MHYLLFYDFVPNYLDRRPAYRAEHLKLAWEAHAKDGLVLAGAFAEPADRGMFLFEGASPDAAKRFANADPYVRNGLVKRWEVRSWTTVVGAMAATPVRPE
ncbi:MAG TPA: YciI-like protein [Casimicrobiaceae bacterium]